MTFRITIYIEKGVHVNDVSTVVKKSVIPSKNKCLIPDKMMKIYIKDNMSCHRNGSRIEKENLLSYVAPSMNE